MSSDGPTTTDGTGDGELTSLSALERRVLDHLDEDRLVTDLAGMVRVPSISGSEPEVDVQQVAADLLAEIGMEVDHWEIDLRTIMSDPWFPGSEVERDAAYGVVGVLGGGHDEEPALVLNGHTDVVPVGDPEAWWGSDPFSGEVYDGAVHGRGAADMKAGVAANIAVARTLRAAGVVLERPLGVHCVVGEEDGGLGSLATLRRGHRGEVAVITEPTRGRLVLANAGALTFRIEVRGRSAHGSLRHQGMSAVEAFWPIHQALLELEAARNLDRDPLFAGRDLPYAISVGTVNAGDWISSVPDRLVAEGRYGVRLDEDPRSARTAFEDAVAEASLKHPWLREQRPVATWPGGQFASGRLSADHPLADEVAGAAVAVGLPDPPRAAEVYGSDLRLYAGVGGVPTLHFGPGDLNDCHAPLEQVNVQETVDVARALTVLALRRCAVRPPG